nr:copia protein [Tanacetum cinerariifolium]
MHNYGIDETTPPPKTSPLEDDDLVEEEAIEVNKTRPLGNDLEDKSLENNENINIKESKSHPLENVIVPNPMDMTIIETKWVYKNKLDENGVVSRNKARLVPQGYNQQEGINYDKTYAPIAKLESIRILFAYACALDFKLFQMDVKSVFLNGFINEEVYVAQPLGFIDFAKPNLVYRLKKALHRLKKAHKAWPDIMFSVCLCTRFQEDPKTSHLEAVKRIFRYIKGTTHLGLWYPKGSDIETIVYVNSDYTRDYVDRKSTSGICTFMRCCLTSWFSKKQTALAIYTTKTEYNVRLVELCTLVLMGVSGTGSFVILIKHPTCFKNLLRIVLSVETRLMLNIVKDACALLRKKFKEDLFKYCIENGIFQDFQDTFEPSNDNTNVVNALQEPFVVKQDPSENSSQSPPQINHHCCYRCADSLEDIFCHQCTCESCRKGAHYGYNCPPKVPIIPNLEPCNNQTIDELPQTLLCFDPTCYSGDGNSITYDSNSHFVNDSPNVFNPPLQPPTYSYEVYGNNAYYGHDCPLQPDNSLRMEDEHLDTIPATESDESIKFSVENLVPNPSESDGEHERDKIYSNPLFDEEIISMKIDPKYFNAESDLIEYLLNQGYSIISSSSNIDSLLDEFTDELTLLKSIPPGINETDCDPEEEIRLIKKLLYDNSSLRPPEEFISENYDAAIKSFPPSPIPVEDIDSFMKEINLSFTPDDPMPPGIEEDDYESERDILILKELLSNDSHLLPENESFHFDIRSSSRPRAKPQDGKEF